MRKSGFPICLFVISVLVLKSCKEPAPRVKYSHPGWDTLQFAGWTMQAPEGFSVTHETGAENIQGEINSFSDTIKIDFDAWAERDADYKDCASHELEQNNESSLGWCEEFYQAGTHHEVWTETVNGRFAVYSRPMKTGQGTTSIHFSDCHHSLVMAAVNLTAEEEKIVFEMFATIDWK